MSRLKPPRPSQGRSPRVLRPGCDRRSPILQKIASLPLLTKEEEGGDRGAHPEPRETDRLLSNNGQGVAKAETPELRHVLRPALPARCPDDWSCRRGRRSASVKVKFTNDTIPENGTYTGYRRRDSSSLLDTFSHRTASVSSAGSPGREMAPLLHPVPVTVENEDGSKRLYNGLIKHRPADDTIV